LSVKYILITGLIEMQTTSYTTHNYLIIRCCIPEAIIFILEDEDDERKTICIYANEAQLCLLLLL